jgi:hypothetical protein
MTVQQPKSPAAVRMRRMRERRAAGMIVVPACEIPPGIVIGLCDLGWLAPNETGNADAVADALWDLAAAALNAGMDRPPRGSTLIACNIELEGVSALVDAKWLSETREQQRPRDIADSLIECAKAAIADGLIGDR